jgi:quercetin dioxygenase-like cupin family protein
MKRFSTLAAAIAAIAGAGATAAFAPAAPSKPVGPSGVHIVPLSHGTIGSRVQVDDAGIQIATSGPRDMLVTSITVDPGGSFGWHSHPGPVLVTVSKGTLAVYDADGSRCRRSTVGAGQSFVEPGGHIHLARNEGDGSVELNAIFLARTGTTAFLTPEPQPKGCNV